MISTSTFVFALALAAGGLVALAWIIFDQRAERRATALWRSTYESFVRNLRSRLDAVEKQTPTALAVEVVELRDAVARLAKTQQRFQGRFDQYVSPDPRPDNSPPTDPRATFVDRDALRREHAKDIMPAGIRK
ncbi:MAG TPA: hypothetical protein VGK73_06910 [Polyangiaceae bacterium]